jgi:hypothetical protein
MTRDFRGDVCIVNFIVFDMAQKLAFSLLLWLLDGQFS